MRTVRAPSYDTLQQLGGVLGIGVATPTSDNNEKWHDSHNETHTWSRWQSYLPLKDGLVFSKKDLVPTRKSSVVATNPK